MQHGLEGPVLQGLRVAAFAVLFSQGHAVPVFAQPKAALWSSPSWQLGPQLHHQPVQLACQLVQHIATLYTHLCMSHTSIFMCQPLILRMCMTDSALTDR